MMILDAVGGAPELVADARSIAFEYVALTQGECGRPVPATVDDLPPVLRPVCVDIAGSYGAFLLAYSRLPAYTRLLAYSRGALMGCVGVTMTDKEATVSRLYVRPGHRGTGVARDLMGTAHRWARDHGAHRVSLDVMASRTGAIACYRTLGYVQVAGPTQNPVPMLTLTLGLHDPRVRRPHPSRHGDHAP